MKIRSSKWRSVFDLQCKKDRINKEQKELEDADLWNESPEIAVKKQKEVSRLKKEVEGLEHLKSKLKEIKDFYFEAQEEEDLLPEIEKELSTLKDALKKEWTKVFLSGKFDRKDAVVEIFSGAGGQDAEDFAAMLLRMYCRYAERRDLKSKVISASYGSSGGPEGRTGIKSASLEVKGDYAFGLLKRERGTHRLVRKSPFSSSGTRHTSFAQVEVFPIISNTDSQVEIKEEDLRVDTFRSSGPGGQYVNRRESAVRVTHIPTGLVVVSQNERLQGENKRIAINVLRSKLQRMKEEKEKKEAEKAKEDTFGSSWGTQIRNYVLHPYKLAKDLRTQVETSNVEEVLDGNLDLLKE